jgi:hypothetical protein
VALRHAQGVLVRIAMVTAGASASFGCLRKPVSRGVAANGRA